MAEIIENEVLENINILRQRVLSGYRVFVNKTQNKFTLF